MNNDRVITVRMPKTMRNAFKAFAGLVPGRSMNQLLLSFIASVTGEFSCLDGKARGVLVKNKDGSVIPPDEYIVFRAADNAIMQTLYHYVRLCEELECDQAQLSAVEELIERTIAWRDAHPERCKIADVEPGELQPTCAVSSCTKCGFMFLLTGLKKGQTLTCPECKEETIV